MFTLTGEKPLFHFLFPFHKVNHNRVKSVNEFQNYLIGQ